MSNVDSTTDQVKGEPHNHDRREETTDPFGTSGLKEEEDNEESTRDADNLRLNRWEGNCDSSDGGSD